MISIPTLQVDIPNLIPYTNYTIHVQAVVPEADEQVELLGSIDEEIVQRTNSTSDDTPTSIDIVEVTTSSQTITINIPPPSQIDTGRVM